MSRPGPRRLHVQGASDLTNARSVALIAENALMCAPWARHAIFLFVNSIWQIFLGLSKQCLIMRDMGTLWRFFVEALPGQFP